MDESSKRRTGEPALSPDASDSLTACFLYESRIYLSTFFFDPFIGLGAFLKPSALTRAFDIASLSTSCCLVSEGGFCTLRHIVAPTNKRHSGVMYILFAKCK